MEQINLLMLLPMNGDGVVELEEMESSATSATSLPVNIPLSISHASGSVSRGDQFVRSIQ